MTVTRRSTAPPVARRRGARPSPSRLSAERDADFAIETVVSSISARIREEIERLRPAIVAGLEAGADVRLLSRASVDRLRSRLKAGA